MVFAQKSPLEKPVFLLGKYPGTPVIPIINDQICLDENRRIVSGLNDTGIEGYLRRWMGGHRRFQHREVFRWKRRSVHLQ